MIHWIDIVSIVFSCVTANHLGLISAIEVLFRHRLPVINCVKCLSFWSTLAYCVYSIVSDGTKGIEIEAFIQVFAVSFLASYIAIWLELFEGFIDFLFSRIYEKIYSDSDNDTSSSVRHEGDTDGSVSQL